YHVAYMFFFLENGSILEQGTPEELFHHPKEDRTREFFAYYSNPQF
ncbi:amino acid ABC transporter ATP-binding protein, partial [Streptococcus suis]